MECSKKSTLLSMIFQEGVSSCSSSALIVSHTMRGMADTTETSAALGVGVGVVGGVTCANDVDAGR